MEHLALLHRSAFALSLSLLACGEAPECPPPPEPPKRTKRQVQPVSVEAHDLSLRIGESWIHLRQVQGRLFPTSGDRPVAINEIATWRGVVEHAEIGVPSSAFEEMLRRPGDKGVAALDDARVRSDGEHLILSGKVRPGGAFLALGFEVKAVPFADSVGRLGVRADEVQLMGIDVDRAMDRADMSFADLLSLDGQRGLSVDGDSLLVERTALFPEVDLEGRVSAVSVLTDGVALVLTDDDTPARPVSMRTVATATQTPKRNGVVFEGADIRFGDIVLIDGRIEVEDLDQSDPLTADVAKLTEQLRAGHTKSLPGSASVRLMLPDHDAFDASDLAQPHDSDSVARPDQAPQ